MNTGTSSTTLHKWGGSASLVWAAAFIVSAGLYLTGNLHESLGPFSYNLADFLSGPVWAASLVMIVFSLRERIGDIAPRRMNLAFLVSLMAAGGMLAVACMRAANRHYHILHPELHLESSSAVLTVWTTLVAGLTATGFHFLGWALVLIGSAAWISRRLPRVLSLLYFIAGGLSLFVYLDPYFEGMAVFFILVLSIWQGIFLFRNANPAGAQIPLH
jgi:hypothetical protein